MKNKRLIPAALAALMLCSCSNSIETNSSLAGTEATTAQTSVSQPPEDGSSENTNSSKDKETTTTTEDTTTTTTTTAPPDPEGTVLTTSAAPTTQSYEITNGCIVAYAGTPQVRAMEQYYYSSDTGAYLAESVDSYANAVGKNVNTYLMMIPTSQEFYTPLELMDSYPSQMSSAVDVYSNLKTAKKVFINQVLEDHKAEYLYSRSDYHWQPLAAYYASKVFAENAGVDFPLLGTYAAVDREGYLGAFYSVNDISVLAEYPDVFTYYKPANLAKLKVTYYDTYFNSGYEGRLFYEDNAISSSYTVFVGTDDTILEVDTNVKNDRVLVIFKDSYGNALVPFLTQSFSKIYLCDNRFFNINSVDFAKNVGATDVLFALGAASTGNPDKIALIGQNMNQ